MNTYLYITAAILAVCVLIAIALRIRSRKSICPNCSLRTSFKDHERVGLCKSCAPTHEFLQFTLPGKKQLGIVALKLSPGSQTDAPL
jgi:hypothetical protein